jgi:hypothetical protein
MMNAAQFDSVAPFIVELYFQGWNVRCMCALMNPCHETMSLRNNSVRRSSKLSLIYVDMIDIKVILNIYILCKQPKIGLP